MFMLYNNRLQYIKSVFVVDCNSFMLQKNVYNSYQRPKFLLCDEKEIYEKCPLFHDYQVYCSNNSQKSLNKK